MDSNKHAVDYLNRHQDRVSRLKREMYANRLNPFNSPISSTGSHGTVSTSTANLTQDLSNFSFNPDDEGTRRVSEDIDNSLPTRSAAGRTTGRFGTRPSNHQLVNTSALGRAFPEWKRDGSTTDTGYINNIHPPTRLPTRPTTKPTARFAPIVVDEETKENIPPPSEETVPVEYLTSKRKRSRAEMQPRVETASNSSTVLSHTPTQPIQPSRRSRFAKAAPPQSPGSPVENTTQSSIQELVSKVRARRLSRGKELEKLREQSEKRREQLEKRSEAAEKPREEARPAMNHQQHDSSPSSSPVNKSALTGRSFLLPPFHHLLDLTSGTLKFSTLRNGVPVFVKHGKARTQFEQPSNQHDTVEAVDVPEEDQEIFVSMDKIREEVRELQEHDHMVQREAEKLQQEVQRLQTELKRFKQRKHSDSAFGSGSESDQSINKALDAQRNLYDEKIAELQSRLEQASRQVGVNDIHSAALTAERDEALHQASQARERAKRLQAELESSVKELDATSDYRHEKEKLEHQNASLRASNETLREQNVIVSTEHKLLIADHNAIRQELAAVHEELRHLRKVYESLRDEKNMLAQDHASMERSNEAYFKENKSLRSKLDNSDRRISDLEKGISRRDKLIHELQANMTQTTEAAETREEFVDLASRVKKLMERQKGHDELIQAKDEKIKSLTEECLVQQREIIKLKDQLHELEKREGTWQHDRIKNSRLSRNNYYIHEDLKHRQKLELAWAEEKLAMQMEIERQREALRSVRKATKQVADLTVNSVTSTTDKPAKVARILDQSQSAKEKYPVSEPSAKSEALNVDDDPTRRVDMTEQSDFLSVLTGEPVTELKEVGQLELQQQNVDQNTQEMPVENTVQTIDSDLPSLPPVVRRSHSDDTLTQKPKQPAGILKKSSQFTQDDNHTGRSSILPPPSNVSLRSRLSTRSRRSVSLDENMTSAFILPDITIQGKKRSSSAEVRPGPVLSEQAQFVFAGLCRHNHNRANCYICTRMAQKTAGSEANPAPKKYLRVRRPTPVSDRKQEPRGSGGDEYEEEPTLRPSMPPGNALAIVLKELEDETKHLEMRMEAKMSELFKLDKAADRRRRKLVSIQYQDLERAYEAKSAQIYKLHDVLEGQKQAGQLMTQEEVDVTIASIRGLDAAAEHTQTQETAGRSESRASEWDGFD